MSKNVVITEGGSGKKFTAKRLRTNTANDGVCDWFPEDEMGEKTITSNGTYRAVDEGLFGYSEVEVDVPAPGGGDFTELYAYENGTYRARSEGYDGYSKVTVDVSSISGEIDDGTGDNPNDYVINMDVDPTTGEMSFPVEIDPQTGEPVIDPETGNPIIVKTKIPSKIKIDVLPSKLEYRTGETVYLTGGVVKAYDNNDNLYTDSTYTDGVIPNSELEVAPLTVSYDAAVDAGGEIVGLSYYEVPANTAFLFREEVNGFLAYFISDVECRVFYDHYLPNIYATDYSYALVIVTDEPGNSSDGYNHISFKDGFNIDPPTTATGSWEYYTYTVDGVEYGRDMSGGMPTGDSIIEGIPINGGGNSLMSVPEDVDYTYGSSASGVEGVKQIEEVTWINPYNQKPLKDSYEIVILKPETDDDDEWSHSSGGHNF